MITKVSNNELDISDTLHVDPTNINEQLGLRF